MMNRILRVCMALLVVLTMVETASARVHRVFVTGRGHVRAPAVVFVRPVQRARRGSSGAALAAGLVAGAMIGGLSRGRSRSGFITPLRGGGGTRITNIDRSIGKTINRGGQVDSATGDDASDDDDSDDSDDDSDSGNDDADSDGDSGGSDDGGDD